MSESAMRVALSEKQKGNEYFKAGKFEESISCYSKAITLCDVAETKQLAVFYSNRAVALLKLERYHLAIDDATQSFMLDKTYWKPLYHRYRARLGLPDLYEASIDITAVCILENHSLRQHVIHRDIILNHLISVRCREFERSLPELRVDDHVVKEYFKIFKNHPLFDESFDAEKIIAYLAHLKDNQNVENRDAKINLTNATISLLNENYFETAKYAYFAFKHVQNDSKLQVTAMIYLASSRIKTGLLSDNRQLVAENFKIFEDALLLDMLNVDIYLHRASCYFHVHLHDKAICDLRHCIAIDSTIELPHFLLFTAEYEISIIEKLKMDIYFIFTSFPRLSAAGHSFEENGSCKDEKKMFERFEQYIQDHPNSSDAPLFYANILDALGAKEKVAEIISEALDRNPLNPELLMKKAEILMAQNDHQSAHPLLLKAMNANFVNKHELFMMLATVMIEQSRLNEALIYCNKAVAQNKSDRHVYFSIRRREILLSTLRALDILGLPSNKEIWSYLKNLWYEE